MAITTTNRRATFIGNDTATVFPFNFKVFSTADLLVITVDTDGNLVTLALGTDYTATLNANQDVDPGGAVTLIAGPLASTYGMIITSDAEELQPVVIQNLGGFYPSVINNEFDLLTILIQQLQLAVDQCIKFSVTDDLSSAQLPPAAQRANKILAFGADGSVSLLEQAPDTGVAYLFEGILLGTKDGVNKIFTLTNGGSPLGKTPLTADVWDNFILIPGVGYTLGPAAGQAQFTTAPEPDDDLYARGTFIP